jgi:hypothetical protein
MADVREITFEYNTGDVQAPIYLDEFVGAYRGIQLAPVVTGVGYVQATMSTKQEVQDSQADWVTWPNGSVSAVSQDTVDPSVTAIRIYRTSGNLRLNVRIV